MGELPCGSQPPAPTCVVWSWRFKGGFAPASAVKGRLHRAFSPISARRLCYAMLMRPNKAETAVHGCHCPGDMAVRMREVLARPWVDVRVCHLFLLLFYKDLAITAVFTKRGAMLTTNHFLFCDLSQRRRHLSGTRKSSPC